MCERVQQHVDSRSAQRVSAAGGDRKTVLPHSVVPSRKVLYGGNKQRRTQADVTVSMPHGALAGAQTLLQFVRPGLV